jgi:DNA-binding transcriptional LysR family regulator
VTLRQLELFLAVSRARSFRKAAARVALSQSALSQQVKALEEELGLRVFDRLGRTIATTEAGRLLETHVQRILAALEGAREAMAELRGVARGTLRLGASTTPGIYVLPRLLGRFTARHPGIELVLSIGNTREIEERVRTAEVDLGIVGGHLAGYRETCVEARVADRLVLVVPPGHRWAGRRAIAPERLADERLLLREDGSATRRLIERALDGAGVEMSRVLELGHTEAIKQGVRAGLGVALVSRCAVVTEVATGHLRALEVKGLALERHFHVIRHEARALTPAGRAFLEFVREDPGFSAPAHMAARTEARRAPEATRRASASTSGPRTRSASRGGTRPRTAS